MLIFLLNWLRRALGVAVLVALFLPFITVQGCGNNAPRITYTGWEAIWLSPLIVTIPLYGAVAAALTFLGKNHPATPVGRLILAVFKLVWAGLAGVWTGAFFGTIPNSFSKWAEVGLWPVLGASAGIFACDFAETARSWIDWRRWRRTHPIPILDERWLQIIAWVSVIAGGVVFLAVPALPTAYAAFSQPRGEGSGDLILVLAAGWVLFLACWALAWLMGWGLRRGLLWSLALLRFGTALSLVTAALVSWVAALVLAHALSSGPPNMPRTWQDWGILAACIAYMTIMAFWAGWSIFCVCLLIGRRRRLFPARRVRIDTADGRRRVLVPRCRQCGARMWLAPDAADSASADNAPEAARLVCRPCGIELPARIVDGRVEPVKEDAVAVKADNSTTEVKRQ